MAIESNDNANSENEELGERDASSPVPSHETHNEKSASTNPPISGFKLWTILIGLTLATFLVSMNASIVATAIPTITQHFHTIADGMYINSSLTPRFHFYNF